MDLEEFIQVGVGIGIICVMIVGWSILIP